MPLHRGKFGIAPLYLLAALHLNADWQAVAADATESTAAKRLDVNDISILWPVPRTAEDAKQLIAIDEKLADGTTSIWPFEAFAKLLETAGTVTVNGSGGATSRIDLSDNTADKAAMMTASNWKIAGIRVDPSAPSCLDKHVALLGSRPQIRLIVQPVTVKGTNAIVHDFTAHLVFDFVSDTLPPAAAGLPPRAVADQKHFKTIVEDLVALKAALIRSGVNTEGELSIHPALRTNSSEFLGQIKGFLKKHLSADRLNAMAFMGIDSPDPWIFFAMRKSAEGYVRSGHPSLQGEMAQMLTMRGGDKIMPHPANSTFGAGLGVSTAELFKNGIDLSAIAITLPQALGGGIIPFREVPDIIANPQMSHFGNTDCMSCHSESTRRTLLDLSGLTTPFQYQRPPGISGVNSEVLPKHRWNVRNFGWFPNFFQNNEAVETVSQRTANEAAESAEFINRVYLADANVPVNPTSGATTDSPSAALPSVTNPLTLVMTIKSPEDRAQLKAKIGAMQKLPPDKNPITVALTKLGNVHFARFVFIGDDKLAVITSYDDDFDAYLRSFINELGEVFDELLPHMKDAPPSPVRDNRDAFHNYVKSNDLPSESPFYSAYPTLKVQDILTLQKRMQQP